MLVPDPKSSAYDHVLAQIAEIEIKIKELQEEKSALYRVLIRIRRGNVSIRDVSRKNSMNRIVIEDTIKNLLESNKNPLKSNYIYTEVSKLIPDLKSTTFRSHLHRMEKKGLITKANGGRGWLTQH